MSRWGICAAVLCAAALLLSHCRDIPPYECPRGRDLFCNEAAGGRCLVAADGRSYCAYSAPDCMTMLRWSPQAAKQYAGQCIDPALIPKDGGVDGPAADGGPDGAADGGG